MTPNAPGVFDAFYAESHTLNACLDHAFSHATELGFDALLYDYSPVPFDRCGTLITPAVFEQRVVSAGEAAVEGLWWRKIGSVPFSLGVVRG